MHRTKTVTDVFESILRDRLRWWAQFLESSGDIDSALEFYSKSGDHLSLVRLHSYLGNHSSQSETFQSIFISRLHCLSGLNGSSF